MTGQWNTGVSAGDHRPQAGRTGGNRGIGDALIPVPQRAELGSPGQRRPGEFVQAVFASGADGAVNLMGVSHDDRRGVAGTGAGDGDPEIQGRFIPPGC